MLTAELQRRGAGEPVLNFQVALIDVLMGTAMHIARKAARKIITLIVESEKDAYPIYRLNHQFGRGIVVDVRDVIVNLRLATSIGQSPLVMVP